MTESKAQANHFDTRPGRETGQRPEMTFRLILIAILALNSAKSHETDSSEVNRLDFTPLYDTIILSDVADIINELQNNMNGPLDTIVSGSESDENVDDLLTEYQRFLEKAHKQRVDYHEKIKNKNKVPSIRRDRFVKSKANLNNGLSPKYDDYYYPNSYYVPNKYTQVPIVNPLDIFIPMNTNSKLRYFGKDTTTPKENHEDEFSIIEKRLLELPPLIPSQKYEPIKSSCFCKYPQLPCDCKCKQCIMPFDAIQHGDNIARMQNSEYIPDDRLRENDNTLNIKIKVDIQLPKAPEVLGNILKNRSHDDIVNSKETSLNMPFPYFNFPIPMDVYGYKKISKANGHETGRKITVHKKKKSRASSGSKKHRKKLVTFHNLNIEPQSSMKVQPYADEKYNWTDFRDEKNVNLNASTTDNNTTSDAPATIVFANEIVKISNQTTDTSLVTDTQTEDSIFVMVNISNSSDNTTGDIHKFENSVENEYPKVEQNIQIKKQRKKREISNNTEKTPKKITNHTNQKIIKKPLKKLIQTSSTTVTKPITTLSLGSDSHKNIEAKKSDKVILADSELMYWPIIPRNQSFLKSVNITKIILDRENKKAKVNMTKESIQNNHTRALERAIFGDINWDDIDTVAPVFMSFVGKYLRGVLTFCSQNICNSMKCEDKVCVHRICRPVDRWNHRGHCSGSNGTDSVASLESIMDLPSNVVFEIVDILQEKMLGKLFGKVTLCIGSKCISFVASKKNFLKSKCSIKELKTGHCPNIKNFKIM